jgi:hypothetical protein
MKNKQLKLLIIIITLSLFLSPITINNSNLSISAKKISIKENSDLISLEFTFNKPTLSDINLDNDVYQRISIEGLEKSTAAGFPALPKKTVKILLPPKSSLKSIELIKRNNIIFSDVTNIELNPTSIQPLSSFENSYAEDFINNPESKVFSNYYGVKKDITKEIKEYEPLYDTSSIYPKQNFINAGIQYKRGMPVLIIDIYPASYNPNSKQVIYYKDIDLKIKTEDDVSGFNDMYRGYSRDFELVNDFVDNKEMIGSYILNSQETNYNLGISSIPQANMLIITTGALKSCVGEYDLNDLAVAHGNNDGIGEVFIETVESIYLNYQSNNKENLKRDKIRKCIRDYYLNNNVDYVLLVGDDNFEYDWGLMYTDGLNKIRLDLAQQLVLSILSL